ncbi:hypothetical protein BO85DRAFT_480905 [Aspergillus piperis CBS 112811]|uniref:Uncharacterized protein n=1 Tax=Aspergillus piperis CBS 112811 TaxID=1448313 RepID=A0A8G1VHS0_9EURO|nr:hypothetical protein BO85DRAFT_480905 [Aspergillus piperis CBS 112811]RAH53704.1 hypothetical protein BO85DRAFT_480905 [Aspergillus piperis CBS 112811]
MSTNASTSHTMSRHTAGLTNDHEKRNPQGGIYTPEFASFNPSQPCDSFISAAVLPHHQVQTHISPTYPVIPRIPELPAQYPWYGGSGYNAPTDLEHWDFVTRLQPGIVPQNDCHQPGTLQENVPWNSFVIPTAMSSSTGKADGQVEGLSYLLVNAMIPSPLSQLIWKMQVPASYPRRISMPPTDGYMRDTECPAHSQAVKCTHNEPQLRHALYKALDFPSYRRYREFERVYHALRSWVCLFMEPKPPDPPAQKLNRSELGPAHLAEIGSKLIFRDLSDH